MNGDELYGIGELARLTGLSVRTIRFYSDSGLLPPTERTHAGYRMYDIHALTRLKFVRTLRELGVDLPTVNRVLSREVSIPELAAEHAEALDVQIRTLRLRRSVLRAVAKRGSSPRELEMVHELARMTEEERQAILDDFWREVDEGLPATENAAWMRRVRAELPDDPTPAQVEAWIEFVELVRDPGFRAKIRTMAVENARMVADGTANPLSDAYHVAMEQALTKVTEAMAAGFTPDSDTGRRIVLEMNASVAAALGRPADPDFDAWLVRLNDTFGDDRAERYWNLLGTINGWAEYPSPKPARDWLTEATRAAR
ncbi:helix-turn-helix domain-containing protein [Kutzneria chonburiensis]|uniref:MerR family transcriptional regulator n=1 Tax=Kutzneria chonburiensis TaxID=1483604 RepID=A0ABV6N0Z4_9PSEU|nr:MerR family transcriptional regulator [Kutzneria chonburiensis]